METKKIFAMKMDSTDVRLINMLQEDSKRPIKELASELNLSIAPVHERIKKLERSGLIKRYVAIVDLQKINRSLINYCNVSISQHNSDLFKEFERQIRKMDEVLECYYVSGNFDYLLKVVTMDMEEYQDFILNRLSKLEMISNINSQFVMKSVKFKTSVNV
jgi:Lrp/AsnC family leucine-responsive transcriptional regulator